MIHKLNPLRMNLPLTHQMFLSFLPCLAVFVSYAISCVSFAVLYIHKFLWRSPFTLSVASLSVRLIPVDCTVTIEPSTRIIIIITTRPPPQSHSRAFLSYNTESHGRHLLVVLRPFSYWNCVFGNSYTRLSS